MHLNNIIYPESSIRLFFVDDNVIHAGNNGMMTKDYDVHECLSNKYYNRSNEEKYRIHIKKKIYRLEGRCVVIIDLKQALNTILKNKRN